MADNTRSMRREVRKPYSIALILVLLISSFNCKSPTGPPPDNTPPGKRDYVWSIDSVDYGNLPSTIQLYSIWGSSAKDVWGAGATPDVRDCLWHYNGLKWSRATEGTPITVSGNGSKIIDRVWGTDQNDVWAIGGRIFSNPEGQAPFVMHFDGTEWTEVTGTANDMPLGCTAIYGSAKDDFWVAELGDVVHYYHGTWTKFQIGANMLSWGITGYQGNVYVDAYDISSGGNRVVICRISNGKFSIDDQTTLTNSSGAYNGKFEPSKVWASGGKLYTVWHRISMASVSGNGSVDQSSWQTIITLPSGEYLVNTFNRTTKDFLAAGYPNLLYEYNGSDWQTIAITVGGSVAPLGTLNGVWGDDNEMFVCDVDNGIVYHGR